MPQGTIKYWNQERGFGFIKPDAAQETDVFLHVTAVERAGLMHPEIGDRFKYEMESTKDGRMRACDLRKA